MKLDEISRKNLQEFFREHFSDEKFNLPNINFHAGKFSGIFTNFLNVHGITFGGNIFIMPDLIARDAENRRKLSLELAAHEIVHVLQYRKLGFARFFYEYLKNYRQNLRKQENRSAEARHEAYLEIPFEIEARRIAREFVEWHRSRK